MTLQNKAYANDTANADAKEDGEGNDDRDANANGNANRNANANIYFNVMLNANDKTVYSYSLIRTPMLIVMLTVITM